MISRRKLLCGFVAAPAIVRIDRLMSLPRAPWPPIRRVGDSLFCNGALVRIADYPELFSVIGQSYGAAPGRFRLPDLAPSFVPPLRYTIAAEPGLAAPVGAMTPQRQWS
jgi:Phage Tail Collar Domain